MEASENIKPFAERAAEEREAIERFYLNSHPSNYPHDRDVALWRFTRNRRSKQLSASYRVGYAF